MKSSRPPSRRCAEFIKLLALLVLAWLLNISSAIAQLASVPNAGIELTQIEVLANAPAGLMLSQVQSGQAGVFIPHEGTRISHFHWNRAMWLRLALKSSHAQPVMPASAVIALPTTYLDKVRLYSPGKLASDPWVAQQAGDFYAPQTWAMRGFYPKFILPSAAELGAQANQPFVIYMQIEHFGPIALQLELMEAKAALDSDLLQLLLSGIGLGSILLAMILTVAMAGLHRDAIYAWYSLYALSAALACASHGGIAIHALWPVSGFWPSTAELCFVLMGGLAQLQFALVLNTKDTTSASTRYLIHALSATCIILALALPIFTSYWQQLYVASVVAVVSAMIVIIWLMSVAWHSGHRLAGVWIASNLPLFCSMVLTAADNFGFVSTAHWSRNLPIYATYLEVILLGLALQWFARERHGQKMREKILAATDPLTGFATAQAFQSQLAQDWVRLRNQNQDIVVAYVRLQTEATNAIHLERLLRRSVRVLRTITGTHDLVARLDGQLLAIAMPNIKLGDELSQRLSRIIALGLMPDPSDKQAPILQFRIAVSSQKYFTQPLDQLDSHLRDLLAQPRGWGSKPIRTTDGSMNNANTGLKLPSLDALWDKALEKERQDSPKLSP